MIFCSYEFLWSDDLHVYIGSIVLYGVLLLLLLLLLFIIVAVMVAEETLWLLLCLWKSFMGMTVKN